MSANDLLTLLNQLIFILLGLVTLISYIRNRSKTRRDIALMFGSLAVLFVSSRFLPAPGAPPNRPVQIINLLALISLPFLLLRLLRYFHSVPTRLMRLAQVGAVLSAFVLVADPLLPRPLVSVLIIAVVLYFVVIDGYAMTAFVRGAVTTSGVVRQRLRFAAAGSGLLASIFIWLLLIVFAPSLKDIATSAALLTAIASALSFYIAFASPRWLRRTWQLTEFRQFLLRISSKPMTERLSVTAVLNELCDGANRAVGRTVSAVAQIDGTAENRWILRHVTDHPELLNTTQENDGILRQAWLQRAPMSVQSSQHLAARDRHLLDTFGADTLLVAPIATQERTWGLLLVFLKHSPLFIDDDLDLITIFAQQSAIFLENGSLVEELSKYSGQLEKRVAERTQELQQTQEQYRRIVETSQEGIWVSNTENRIIYVNARMAEMLGYTVEEMLGDLGYNFVDAENRDLAREKREERYQGAQNQYELKFRRKDGSELHTLISATPMLDDDGKVIGSLAMIADITERKRADDEIRKLNAELEERVTERTAQLSLVNRELEAFSYSVSHDLRAPLRAMDGFSQALLEDYSGRLDENGQNFLGRIRANSQHMGQLIDSLLQLSRVSRGELEFREVNLSQLVRTIEADLRVQYPERKAQFVVQDGLVVKGDERLLRIALYNLLNNAWKFTSKTPEPRVEFGTTERDGREVYFLRDNGVGFNMAYADKLFGAFQRLHSMDEFEGTGIGLATVERIISRHYGEIWVEAAVNQGATFYFCFNENPVKSA